MYDSNKHGERIKIEKLLSDCPLTYQTLTKVSVLIFFYSLLVCVFWLAFVFFRSDLQTCLISNLIHKILIYLHTIHLLKFSTCFEHYPAHLQDVYVVIVYMHPLVVSLSAGDCIYNYDIDLLKMSRVMLETCRGF
jgi:hypothetical protein